MNASTAESEALRRQDEAFATIARMQTDVALAYDVGERLNAGPRSTLYRATRRTDGKRVLLRTPRSTGPWEREIAEFAHEHAVLTRLVDAPVIKAFALEQIEGRPWLVLDDVGGQSLAAIASRFRAPDRSRPSTTRLTLPGSEAESR